MQPGLKSTVLDMLDPASLPEGWAAQYDDATARRYYVHASSDVTVWEHPNLAYYRGVVFMETGGLAQMMDKIDLEPPSAEQIIKSAQSLGIQEDEDRMVQEVALFECCAPLPPGHVEEEGGDGQKQFRCVPPGCTLLWRTSEICAAHAAETSVEQSCRNAETNECTSVHPLQEYFRELVRRRRIIAAHTSAAAAAEEAGNEVAASDAPSAAAGMRRSHFNGTDVHNRVWEDGSSENDLGERSISCAGTATSKPHVNTHSDAGGVADLAITAGTQTLSSDGLLEAGPSAPTWDPPGGLSESALLRRVADVKRAAGCQPSATTVLEGTLTVKQLAGEGAGVERLRVRRRAFSFSECENGLMHGQLAEVCLPEPPRGCVSS